MFAKAKEPSALLRAVAIPGKPLWELNASVTSMPGTAVRIIRAHESTYNRATGSERQRHVIRLPLLTMLPLMEIPSATAFAERLYGPTATLLKANCPEAVANWVSASPLNRSEPV